MVLRCVKNIKTQEQFLDHTTSLSNFIYDAEKKGNLSIEEAEKYQDLIRQLELVFDERFVKTSNERLVQRLRNVE
tara:strand:- start:748 stop:972 length:225 start_codon:yes stop_codon:yes gene_type:complete